MTPKGDKLNGLEKVTEFLKLVFLSGNVDGERPISCMIVAPVSSGKTTVVKQFKNNKNVLVTTDSTAFGIIKNYQNQLKTREIKHIVIPDLLNALARKKVTADQLLLFINISSEDGIFPSKSYGIDVNEFIEPFGWVLCLTEDGYRKKRKFLESVGFLSRFFIVHYKYSLEQIQEILDKIIEEAHPKLPDIGLKNLKTRRKIKGNSEIFRQLSVYSKLLCKHGDAEILRMQKKLQTLVKASAFARNDNKVTKEDLDKVVSFIELIKEN